MQYYIDENGGNNLGLEDAGTYGENVSVPAECDVGVITRIYSRIQTGSSGTANYVAVDVEQTDE